MFIEARKNIVFIIRICSVEVVDKLIKKFPAQVVAKPLLKIQIGENG